MYSLELIKISEAYTKQMYKANITESTVAESTRRVVAVTDGNAWAVVDADTQEVIQQYDSADKLNKDVREFGWLMVDEKPINISECGKQCNESYEEFYVKLEKEPFNILEDDCWQCDELLTLIRNNDKEEEFNDLAKETFMDNAPTISEFNDWCRFDYDSICDYLGLSDEDEDDEDEDDDVELDESGTTAEIEAGKQTEAPKPNTKIPKTEAPKAPKPEAPKPEAPKGDDEIYGINGSMMTTLDAMRTGENLTPQFWNKVAGVPKPEAPKPEAPKAPKPEAPKTEAPKAPKPSWWDTTVDAAGKKYKELEDWAKKNPGLAMAAAAGVGGLTTALLTRKRRRRG